MTDLTYEPLPYESMARTLEEIGAGDPDRVGRAVLAAALGSADREWVEACAVSLTLAPEIDVQRAALLAIAHLARRFGEVTVPAVSAVMARADREVGLASALSDLRDDLATFGIDA